MADKKIEKQIDADVKDAEITTTTQTAKKSMTYRPLIIAMIVLLLLSFGSIYWLYQQINKQSQQQQALFQSLLSDAEQQTSQWQSAQSKTQSTLQQLAQQDQLLTDELKSLANRDKLTSADIKKAWALHEIHYLLDIANQRSVLAHDVNGAVAALNLADEQLQAISDYRLHPLRALIDQEIKSLEALAGNDIEGFAIELQTLANQTKQLRVKKGPQVDLLKTETVVEPTVEEEKSTWQRVTDDLWQKVLSFVVIRHDDLGEAPVLVPEQRYFLYQNLQLQLESARLMLLRGDETTYQQNVETAIVWLNQYFVGPEKDAMLTALTKLQAADITIEIPDISASIQWLEEYQP